MSDQISKTSTGLFQDMRDILNKTIDALESEQSKVNKALFEVLSPEQRDRFCKSLSNQGIKTKRIEKITGKSQSTVNRHLNSKNS